MSGGLEHVPSEYKVPEGLRTLANYLRSQNGVKVRSGIEHEKRVDYFKGNQGLRVNFDDLFNELSFEQGKG